MCHYAKTISFSIMWLVYRTSVCLFQVFPLFSSFFLDFCLFWGVMYITIVFAFIIFCCWVLICPFVYSLFNSVHT